MQLTSHPYGKTEALQGDYVIATYRVYGVEIQSALSKIGGFAIGQTVGTWVKVPGITDEMIRKYQARVVGMEFLTSVPKNMYSMKIAFPTVNFAESFAAMLTGILGNDVSTSLEVRLVGLEFVNDAIRDMGYHKKSISPINKLRNITCVKGRPILLNMIKPCLGFDEEIGAGFFREVALGGMDLIKDDELLSNPSYSEVERRVKAYNKAAQEAATITGKETIYIPNITDRPSKMRDHAKAAIQAGAKACLVNYIFTGLDAFSEICQEFDDELFVMGHYAGIGVFNGEMSGVSNPVYLGTLPRLAGADALMTMYVQENKGLEYVDFLQNVQQQMCYMPDVDKVVTTVGGGITPLDIPRLIDDLGMDVIIGIGGAIQGHKMGATSGAEAAMKAVNAAANNMDLYEAAKTCESLQVALDTWGRSK